MWYNLSVSAISYNDEKKAIMSHGRFRLLYTFYLYNYTNLNINLMCRGQNTVIGGPKLIGL